jgi:hypothetical protein
MNNLTETKNEIRHFEQIHLDLGFEIVQWRGFETREYIGKKGNDTLITNDDGGYDCIYNGTEMTYDELKSLLNN